MKANTVPFEDMTNNTEACVVYRVRRRSKSDNGRIAAISASHTHRQTSLSVCKFSLSVLSFSTLFLLAHLAFCLSYEVYLFTFVCFILISIVAISFHFHLLLLYSTPDLTIFAKKNIRKLDHSQFRRLLRH